MSRTSAPSALTRPDVFKVAVYAKVDPRTVMAYLSGASVWAKSATAIEAALRRIKRADLVRTNAGAVA